MSENRLCQYCGAAVENPQHKSCQWCNAMIQQANCDGVFSRVYDTAMAVSKQQLTWEARRNEIQSAYDSAVKG